MKKVNKSIITANKSAYRYLEEDLRDEAYACLEKNFRESPCLLTAYNLAYFYLEFGEKSADGRWYPCPKKAIDVLKDAETHSGDSYSLLGHAYYSLKDYSNALLYFEKAYTMNKSVETVANYAFLLYIAKGAEAAVRLFDEACDGGIYMRYCSLFCRAIQFGNNLLNEVNAFAKSAEDYDISEIDTVDIAILYFSVNDFKKVIELYDSVLDEYLITPFDFHIISYSLHRLNRDEDTQKYYKTILYDYSENYEEPRSDDIKELKKIYEGREFLKKPEIALQSRLTKNYRFLIV
jgi:tetratricopeptide (TPR) repeat protein